MQVEFCARESDLMVHDHVNNNYGNLFPEVASFLAICVDAFSVNIRRTGVPKTQYDTMASVNFGSTISEWPSKNASRQQWKKYFESQLDSVIGRIVLRSLTVLGGPNTRLQGGVCLAHVLNWKLGNLVVRCDTLKVANLSSDICKNCLYFLVSLTCLPAGSASCVGTPTSYL